MDLIIWYGRMCSNIEAFSMGFDESLEFLSQSVYIVLLDFYHLYYLSARYEK